VLDGEGSPPAKESGGKWWYRWVSSQQCKRDGVTDDESGEQTKQVPKLTWAKGRIAVLWPPRGELIKNIPGEITGAWQFPVPIDCAIFRPLNSRYISSFLLRYDSVPVKAVTVREQFHEIGNYHANVVQKFKNTLGNFLEELVDRAKNGWVAEVDFHWSQSALWALSSELHRCWLDNTFICHSFLNLTFSICQSYR